MSCEDRTETFPEVLILEKNVSSMQFFLGSFMQHVLPQNKRVNKEK